MSSTRVGQVVVDGTVEFTRATTTSISLGVDAVTEDGEPIASIDDKGVLSFCPHLCSEIAVATGTLVHGIQPMGTDGLPLESADYRLRGKPLVMLRAEDGGYFVAVHESLVVTEPTYRITSAYGQNVLAGPDAVQIFWSVIGAAASDRRFRCPDWDHFTADPLHWVNGETSTRNAIARLAKAVSGLLGDKVPE